MNSSVSDLELLRKKEHGMMSVLVRVYLFVIAVCTFRVGHVHVDGGDEGPASDVVTLQIMSSETDGMSEVIIFVSSCLPSVQLFTVARERRG